jgi:predicted RNA-binding Zn-ribbon protein involved in translation (DUF1610 family)
VPERKCWDCSEAMSFVVEDGVARLYCPNCGIKKRRGRNRTDRRMRATRASDRMSFGDRNRKF